MSKILSYSNVNISRFFKINKKNFSDKTFLAKDLIFEENKDLFIKPDYNQPLQFGKYHTDYILEVDHEVGKGWGNPIISKYKNFSIDPRNQSLHYAMQLFEGMKAYKNKEGKLFLFRPDLNMQRLRSSAKRIGFPDFEGEEFIKLISELVKIEKNWIKDEPGYSLYLRPTFISMTDVLGVLPPTKTKLFCICSPVGPYFGTKPVMNSIKVMCNDSSYVRAFQGGFGQFKLGA